MLGGDEKIKFGIFEAKTIIFALICSKKFRVARNLFWSEVYERLKCVTMCYNVLQIVSPMRPNCLKLKIDQSQKLYNN